MIQILNIISDQCIKLLALTVVKNKIFLSRINANFGIYSESEKI